MLRAIMSATQSLGIRYDEGLYRHYFEAKSSFGGKMASSLPEKKATPSRMSGPASRVLAGVVTVAVASLGAERLDLFQGNGPFALTPFLIVAPILVVVTLVVAIRNPASLGQRTQHVGLALLAALILLAFVSTSFSESARSLNRALLLAALVAGAWGLVLIVRQFDLARSARIGALVGLGLFVAFNIWILAMYGAYGLDGPAFVGPIDAHLVPYGEGIVRLAGGSLDPNRAALSISLFVYLLIGDPVVRLRASVWSTIAIYAFGAVLVAGTLSRSGALTYFIMTFGVLIYLFVTLSRRGKLIVAASLGVLLALGAAVVAFGGSALQRIIFSRLDLSSGSAQEHADLLVRGIGSLTGEPQQPLLGIGYGESYSVLQDMFPGNVYANFHSLYLTIGVEVGLIGLAVVLALLVAPLGGRRPWLALSMIIFGINYQATSDPVFWVQVALLWGLDSPLIVRKWLIPKRRRERERTVAEKDGLPVD